MRMISKCGEPTCSHVGVYKVIHGPLFWQSLSNTKSSKDNIRHLAKLNIITLSTTPTRKHYNNIIMGCFRSKKNDADFNVEAPKRYMSGASSGSNTFDKNNAAQLDQATSRKSRDSRRKSSVPAFLFKEQNVTPHV